MLLDHVVEWHWNSERLDGGHVGNERATADVEKDLVGAQALSPDAHLVSGFEARVPIDLREASERGDAMRALRSLLDAAERDRDIAIDSEREIERRVREVLMYRESRPSP